MLGCFLALWILQLIMIQLLVGLGSLRGGRCSAQQAGSGGDKARQAIQSSDKRKGQPWPFRGQGCLFEQHHREPGGSGVHRINLQTVHVMEVLGIAPRRAPQIASPSIKFDTSNLNHFF